MSQSVSLCGVCACVRACVRARERERERERGMFVCVYEEKVEHLQALICRILCAVCCSLGQVISDQITQSQAHD